MNITFRRDVAFSQANKTLLYVQTQFGALFVGWDKSRRRGLHIRLDKFPARAECIEQSADVRIYELTAEVARLRECYEAALARNLDVREFLNRLIAENTRLREALKRYAKHDTYCGFIASRCGSDVIGEVSNECNCGLAEALEAQS